GTLYGALTALTGKGWIVQLPMDEGSRKKEYKLTDKGREILMKEIERLRELVTNGDMIVGNTDIGGK
ncbi:MAG: PadR family transcriptional regulator, partial [Clostridiales bacterium]|nr:PadR family transcriptional regulator [Clostridiales bacterium]